MGKPLLENGAVSMVLGVYSIRVHAESEKPGL
jgi:hypothetical protein